MNWKIFLAIGVLCISILVFIILPKIGIGEEYSLLKSEGKEAKIMRADFEVTSNYSDDNKTINFYEGGVYIGKAELKSHKRYDEVLRIPQGENKAIIWYELSDFKTDKKDAIIEVEFIDMRRTILDLSSAKGEVPEEEIDKYIIPNPNYLQPINVSYDLVYLNNESKWEKYESKDIPKDKINIGIKVNITGKDFYDVVVNLFNIKIEKHALVEGTNAGFVTSTPTGDPAETSLTIDGAVVAGKFTSPSDAVSITEIGWYANAASEESNWEIGLYEHNASANYPQAVLQWDQTNAKGTTEGWKSTSVSWSVTGSTTYWFGVQLDNVATTTGIDYNTNTGRRCSRASQTTLLDPFVAGASCADNRLLAIYAVYTTSGGGTECWAYNPSNKVLYVPSGCTYYQPGVGYI